jgi:hypothetical protein
MKLSSRSSRTPKAAVTTAVAVPASSARLTVVGSVLFSQLAASHSAVRSVPADVTARAAELARLLLAAEPDAAHALIGELLADAGPFALSGARWFEPTAQRLGDLWLDDHCNEFEVTLGLCRLQTSIRCLAARAEREHAAGSPVALIAPQPGEVHLLGAALHAEVMWRAGWDVHAEFPSTDGALQRLVSDTWFDVLDLSLSAAFRREHWLRRMSRTIARGRSASRNPKLIVSASGRMFSESNGSEAQVGADLHCATALQCMPSIRRLRES